MEEEGEYASDSDFENGARSPGRARTPPRGLAIAAGEEAAGEALARAVLEERVSQASKARKATERLGRLASGSDSEGEGLGNHASASRPVPSRGSSRSSARDAAEPHSQVEVDLSKYDAESRNIHEPCASLIDLVRLIVVGSRSAVASALAGGQVDILERDSHGWNAAHWAASLGDVVCMALVIREMVKCDCVEAALTAREYLTEWTPLHVAAVGRHVDVARQLLIAATPSCDLLGVRDATGDRPIDMVRPEAPLNFGKLSVQEKCLIEVLEVSPHNGRGTD